MLMFARNQKQYCKAIILQIKIIYRKKDYKKIKNTEIV